MNLESRDSNSRFQRLGEAARSRVGRIRRIKVPQRGLAIGVVFLVIVTGAYLLWRAPFGISPAPTDVTFFQIATGSTAGTYFPVGETIAAAISEPPASEACDDDSRCGVRGVLAVVKSSQGSTANVRNLVSGRYDAAFVQADIADWAYRGLNMFENERAEGLRGIAALYPEAVQLVVSKSSNIKKVADLKGHRVSIDRPGSGTQADALLILKAHSIQLEDFVAEEIEVSTAADLMIEGELDAFFLISGTPAKVISDLTARGLVNLVPINGPPVEALVESSSFFVTHEIPAGTYPDIGANETISVKALFVTNADKNEALVHDITAALWRPGNRSFIDRGHSKGQLIRLETALDGLSIPLHPGAERYYREAGQL